MHASHEVLPRQKRHIFLWSELSKLHVCPFIYLFISFYISLEQNIISTIYFMVVSTALLQNTISDIKWQWINPEEQCAMKWYLYVSFKNINSMTQIATKHTILNVPDYLFTDHWVASILIIHIHCLCPLPTSRKQINPLSLVVHLYNYCDISLFGIAECYIQLPYIESNIKYFCRKYENSSNAGEV